MNIADRLNIVPPYPELWERPMFRLLTDLHLAPRSPSPDFGFLLGISIDDCKPRRRRVYMRGFYLATRDLSRYEKTTRRRLWVKRRVAN